MGDDKELQKPVLPRDVFRSTLTFKFYESSTFRLPWVISSLSLGLCLGLGCVAYKMYDNLEPFSGMCAFFFFELAVIFPLRYLDYMRLRLDITPLVQQVSELKPGTDTQRWDEVAHRFNLTLYQERFWNTPYYFFNGEHAQYVFSQRVVRPYFNGNFDDITDADKMQTVRDYLQSLNEKFEMSLKEDLPQLPLSAELPKDTQWSFFFFFPRLHTIQIIVLCLHQGMAFLLLLRASFEVGFRFILYSFLQCSTWVNYRLGIRSVHPVLGTIQAINFLAIITKVSPGKGLDKWDQIAMLMNRNLSEDNGGYSKNIFFDGKYCLNFYKTYFEPLSIDGYTNEFIELKEIVKTVQSKIE